MNAADLYKKADEITDSLGKPLDEGIKKTVVGLWAHGIPTRGSCEGHRDTGEPFPWVDIEADQPENWRQDKAQQAAWIKANHTSAEHVRKLLHDFNRLNSYEYPLVLLPKGGYGAVRLATGRLHTIADELQAGFLEELQKQMSDFGDYLLGTVS